MSLILVPKSNNFTGVEITQFASVSDYLFSYLKCNYFSHCLHFSAYTTWFMSKTEWKLLLAAAIGNSLRAAGICRRALRLRAEGSVRPSECGLPLAPLITTMRQRKRTDESSKADAKNGKQSFGSSFFWTFSVLNSSQKCCNVI